ncbi:hypothetical protein PO124_31895 [Bacillus licheniformis]|nr:hypothetical protein [Bacillus licheniformis]
MDLKGQLKEGNDNVERIAVIGTGYVGLVSGTCLPKWETRLSAAILMLKIRGLSAGVMPIYENGLKELVDKT